jgi:hypothetical protein
MRDSRAENFLVMEGRLAALLLASVLLGGNPAAAQQAAQPAPQQTGPEAVQQLAPAEIVPTVDGGQAPSPAPVADATPAVSPASAPASVPSPPPAPASIPAPSPAQNTAPSPGPSTPQPPQVISPQPAPQVTGPPGASIQVETLAPVDASWIGILSESKDGLPHNMWNGTPRALVAADLPRLQPVASPLLSSLERRLLLSDAASPSGDNPPGGATLIDLRLDRLEALGFVPPALDLLKILPDSMTDETTDRAGIELRFANDDATGACNDVAGKMLRYTGPWWARALIACQALSGDSAKAQLGQQLLADQNAPRDPGFDALIDRLGGLKDKIPSLADPSPIELTLLAAAKQKLTDDDLANASLPAVRFWALDAGVPPEQRLAAAERAEIYGAIDPDVLGAVYDGIASKQGAASVISKSGKKPLDARGRALLYQVAHNSSDPVQRRAAILLLLADAKRRGCFAASALLLADATSGIPADGSNVDFAADAARVFLAAGAADKAEPWIAVAQSKSLALLEHWASGGPAQPGDAQLLQDALAELAARDPKASPRQADLLNGLATALGAPALAAATAPSGPASQAASGAGKGVGEIVLTSLLAASSGSGITADPVALAHAVSSLRQAGLDADARRLAIEAAIDAGI